MLRCIIEKHDRKTRWGGWRYYWRQRYRSLGLLASQCTEKNAEILVEIWNRFFLTLWGKVNFRTWCSTTQIDRNFSRKCTTSFISCQNHNGEVVDRSWLCFSPSQTCVKYFTCRLMCADTTKCVHLLIRKGIFDRKHALERLRSHEHSMKHIDATIIFIRRCN